MTEVLDPRVREIAQNLLKILQDSENYVFSELAIENEVEKILDEIIEGYPRGCSCVGDCECQSPQVVLSYGVLQKILLMLVQAKIEVEDFSNCLTELEDEREIV